MNSFTFCILEPFKNFRYGMDSDSLLKVVMGPAEVSFRLSFGELLYDGQIMPHLLFVYSATMPEYEVKGLRFEKYA